MTLSDQKLDLIHWISSVKNEAIIHEIIKLRDQVEEQETSVDLTTEELWDSLPKEHQEAINRGLEDVKKGRVLNHIEVRKLYERLL